MKNLREKIDEVSLDRPIYVRGYTRSKFVPPYNYITLINYLKIFKRFLKSLASISFNNKRMEYY